MFLPIQKSDIQKCASLYTQVFSSPPWSEPWTDEEADNRLRYLMDSKGFFGFLAEKDGKTIGFVLGTTEPFVGMPLHTSPRLAELSGVAGALDKDGYLLQAQP